MQYMPIGTRVKTDKGNGIVVGHERHGGEKFPIVALDCPENWACWKGHSHPVFRNVKDIEIMAENNTDKG